MDLTLYLPGLIWLDSHTADDACTGLSLPMLSRLLERGKREVHPCEASAFLCHAFGLNMLAPARQVASANSNVDDTWLLAQPVHVRLERDRMLLFDDIHLSKQESITLLTDLNAHFAEDGICFMISPSDGQWLLHTTSPTKTRFFPLMDVIGNHIDDYRPQHDETLCWTKLMNEVQMFLFAHPVNLDRESRGVPVVNSLWLWGGGAENTPEKMLDILFADDPLWLHYARQTQILSRAVQPSLDLCLQAAKGNQRVGIYLPQLYLPAQYRQVWGWRTALQAMEKDWFLPLVNALRHGKLRSAQIYCHGEHGITCKIQQKDLWKFWRQSVSLADLSK